MPDPEMPENGSDPRDRLEALDRAVKDALGKRAAEQAAADARELRAKQAQAGGAAWRTLSQLVLATTLVALAGYGVDQAFGTGPGGLLVGLLLGFAAGMWMVARSALRLQAGQKPDASAQGSAPESAPGSDAPTEGRDGDLR